METSDAARGSFLRRGLGSAGAGLILGSSMALIAGCAGAPPTVTPVPPTTDPAARVTVAPGGVQLSLEMLNTQLGVGFERVTFRLVDPGGTPVREGQAEAVFYEINTSTGEPRRAASGPALFFGPLLPGGGAWVVYTEFDASGRWALDIAIDMPDGTNAVARTELDVAGRTDLPRIGMRPPSMHSPTLAEVGDLALLTSDKNPDPDLYAMTVGDAVGTGKPTAVFFGSPAHCDDEMCRAMMTEFRATASRFGERMNFIHIESRDLEAPERPSAAALNWGLPSEPWLFLFDGRGFLQYRIEGGIDRDELGLLIERFFQGI